MDSDKTRELYHKNKEAGICVACGCKSATNGTVYCTSCRERRNTLAKIKRKERLENNLCTICGNPISAGDRCDKCRNRSNEYQREYIANTQKNGKCVICKKKLDRSGWLCINCNDKRNKKAKNDRDFFISIGICPQCRKNQIIGDEKQCLECSAKNFSYNKKRREKLGSDFFNRQHKEWSKKKYQEDKEKGVCTRCRKRKADDGYSTCSMCRAKSRKYRQSKEKPKINRADRYKIGLCYFCDKPVEKGYKVCEYHHKKNIENSMCEKSVKAREKMKKEFSFKYGKGLMK